MSERASITPIAALSAFGLAGVLMIALAPLARALGGWGIALVQLVAIAAPAVGLAALRSKAPARALGLRLPRARALVGAALVGISFWYLNLALIVPINEALAGDDASVRRLAEMLAEPALPLWATLVVLALLPAICEELLFRGALARAFWPALGLAGAIGAQAALFSLFHLSPARLLPTLCFGIVLGAVALWAGSTLASGLTHALNNGVAITLASTAPGARVLHELETHSVATIALAAAATAGGLWLVLAARERAPPPAAL
jgi:membrane protease YdiL (CAAX protease family)